MEKLFKSKDIEKWLKENPRLIHEVVNDDIIVILAPPSNEMWFYNKKNKKAYKVPFFAYREVKTALKELL